MPTNATPQTVPRRRSDMVPPRRPRDFLRLTSDAPHHNVCQWSNALPGFLVDVARTAACEFSDPHMIPPTCRKSNAGPGWRCSSIRRRSWTARRPRVPFRACGVSRVGVASRGDQFISVAALPQRHVRYVATAATSANCANATSGSSISGCQRFSHSKLYKPV